MPGNDYFDKIKEKLKGHIIQEHIFNRDVTNAPKIRMIDGDNEVKPDYIYIGEKKEVCKLLERQHAPVSALFCIAGCTNQKLDIKEYHSYIGTDMSEPALFNSIFAAIQEYNEKNKQMAMQRYNFRNIFNGKIAGLNAILKVVNNAIPEPEERFNIAIVFFKQTPDGTTITACRDSILAEFGRDNSFAYTEKDRIIIIFTHNSRNNRFPPELREQLESVLEKYDAFMSISTDSGRYQRMPEEYEIADEIRNVVAQMNLYNEDRIFSHEEYGLHVVLQYCCKQYDALFSTSDSFYKGHPAIVTLREYDKEHNTDLCDTLYQYLLHGMSISDTADAVFAHRNTIHNKIKKITTIIDDELEDGKVRFNLFFACMLMKYYDCYRDADKNR